MPDEAFTWMKRIKAVEREYGAIRLGIDRLILAVNNDPSILKAQVTRPDIGTASKRLEGTYIIRVFCEFETSLQQFIGAFNIRKPKSTEALINRVRDGGRIPQGDTDAVHQLREYDAIEFSTIVVPAGATLSDFAAQLRGEAQSVGIPIVNYAIGADFINGSGGDLPVEIERVKREVDIAAILGSPCMRHDATSGFPAAHVGPRGFDAALPRLVQGCRAVAEYAARKQIRTMVENHGFFCQDSERLERLVNAVAHPNFGLLIEREVAPFEPYISRLPV